MYGRHFVTECGCNYFTSRFVTEFEGCVGSNCKHAGDSAGGIYW